MKYEISFVENPSPEDIKVLDNGIIQEHKIKKDMQPLKFFAFFIRDEKNTIVGGCAGDNMYGSLFVAQLWVAEPLRGKGYGTKLMGHAEKLARDSGCAFMAGNTFDWEALEFYKKLGFTVELERKGFDKNSVFCFLRKDLNL